MTQLNNIFHNPFKHHEHIEIQDKENVLNGRSVDIVGPMALDAVKYVGLIQQKKEQVVIDPKYTKTLAERHIQKSSKRLDTKVLKLLTKKLKVKKPEKSLAPQVNQMIIKQAFIDKNKADEKKLQDAYNAQYPLNIKNIEDVLSLTDQEVKARGREIIQEKVKAFLDQKLNEKVGMIEAHKAEIRAKEIQVSEVIANDLLNVLGDIIDTLEKLLEIKSEYEFYKVFLQTLNQVENKIDEFSLRHANYEWIRCKELVKEIKEGAYNDLSAELFIEKFRFAFGGYADQYLKYYEEATPAEQQAFRERLNRLAIAKLDISAPVLISQQMEISCVRSHFKEYIKPKLDEMEQKRNILDELEDFFFEKSNNEVANSAMERHIKNLINIFSQTKSDVYNNEEALGDHSQYHAHETLITKLEPLKEEHTLQILKVNNDLSKIEGILACLGEGESLAIDVEDALNGALYNMNSLLDLETYPKKFYRHWEVVISNTIEALTVAKSQQDRLDLDDVIIILTRLLDEREVHKEVGVAGPVAVLKYGKEKVEMALDIIRKTDSVIKV